MKIKRMAAIAAAALTIMVLAGCGKSTSAAADKSQVKIGILQLIDQQRKNWLKRATKARKSSWITSMPKAINLIFRR